MKREDFEKDMASVKAIHGTIQAASISPIAAPIITMLSIVALLLTIIAKILWTIKETQDSDGERLNDGVNCLGRIEEQLYWFQQNR